MKESTLSKLWLPKWQEKNPESHLFRNNTGAFLKGQNWIAYGIGLLRKNPNKPKAPKRPVGGGDYIGFTVMCIPGGRNAKPCKGEKNCKEYAEMGLVCSCCFKFAVFSSVEFKTKGVRETKDQKDFKKLVNNSGGIAYVVKEGEI